MPPGTRIADYLDAIQYRNYTDKVLRERRRFLAFAAISGDDAWLMNAPIEEIAATVQAQSQIRSKKTLQKLGMAIEDYRRWRRRQEGGNAV